MTTPERLRRRQRIESLFIAVLAACLVAAFLYFQGQASAQQQCLSTYISVNSETSAIRSKLVERESKTTRAFLLDATAAKSREEFAKTRAQYARRLMAIDQARDENPVRTLPKGVCD